MQGGEFVVMWRSEPSHSTSRFSKSVSVSVPIKTSLTPLVGAPLVPAQEHKGRPYRLRLNVLALKHGLPDYFLQGRDARHDFCETAAT